MRHKWLCRFYFFPFLCLWTFGNRYPFDVKNLCVLVWFSSIPLLDMRTYGKCKLNVYNYKNRVLNGVECVVLVNSSSSHIGAVLNHFLMNIVCLFGSIYCCSSFMCLGMFAQGNGKNNWSFLRVALSLIQSLRKPTYCTLNLMIEYYFFINKSLMYARQITIWFKRKAYESNLSIYRKLRDASSFTSIVVLYQHTAH